jgi:hypothetical protein
MGYLANLSTFSSLVALALMGCAPDSNFARSCGGERVLECDPYEWSSIAIASFTPGVPLGDPTVRVDITVDFETCGESPAPITVNIQALVGSGDDIRVADVATVRAGMVGDSRIEETIDNPFTIGGTIPPDEDITLRFVPVIGGCEGDAFELPYRTGPLIRP